MPKVTSPVRGCALSLAIAVSLLALTACGGSKKAATSGTSGSAPSSSVVSDSIAPTSTVPTTTMFDSTVTSSTVPAPAGSSSAARASGGGAKCTDLSDASAGAALGKKVTVKGTASTSVAGLSICDVTIAGEIYPIQLDVNSANAQALFTADQQVSSVAALSGLGDKAFRSEIGVEALSGGVDVKVIGPAGPVLSNDFSVPTALVKAMIAAIR